MVEVVFEKECHRSAAYDGTENIGEGIFTPSEKIWTIDSIRVDEKHSGQGIARKLVDEIVGEARREGVKITPICPYALHLFQKEEIYSDIWSK